MEFGSIKKWKKIVAIIYSVVMILVGLFIFMVSIVAILSAQSFSNNFILELTYLVVGLIILTLEIINLKNIYKNGKVNKLLISNLFIGILLFVFGFGDLFLYNYITETDSDFFLNIFVFWILCIISYFSFVFGIVNFLINFLMLIWLKIKEKTIKQDNLGEENYIYD